MNVITFPDRPAPGARENLAKLVARARALQVFGPTVDFDSSVWNLTHCLDRKPGKACTSAVLYFTARQDKPSRTVEGRTELSVPFSEFVKSMIVIRHLDSNTTFAPHQRTLMVVRFLYDALAKAGHDIVEACPADFRAAAGMIREAYKETGAYASGEELERIGKFVDRHQLCGVPIRFSNPIERPDDHTHGRIGEQSRKGRSKKLPSDEYVAAVVEASLVVRDGGCDRDLSRMAVLEILLCAPWRINELLGVRADCERRESRPDGTIKYGFAHEGSKEAPDDTKWFPSKMVPIAQRALADVLRLTQPSREIARWLEDHPGRAWLPEPWRLRDRKTPMTAADVAAAMGFAQRAVAIVFMRSRRQEPRTVDRQCWFDQGQLEDAILSDIEAVLEEVPKGRRMSEYLFLFPLNYFHASKAAVLPIPTFFSQAQMRDFLVGDDAEREERVDGGSIFKRLNIMDSAGRPFRIPSHGPRHYLNNIANEGLLSDLDLARWSGRKDISQNAAYDHTGGAPLGRVMRELAKTKAMQGPIVATAHKLRPTEREEFLKARFATAHTTDIGMCVQDWSLAPCPTHGACAAGCGDHMLIKGNLKHRRRTEQLLAEHESMLAQGRQEMAEGTFGAGPWVEHNERMIAGLKRAIAIHDSPIIADGTVVES